jgi:hypothetical protein
VYTVMTTAKPVRRRPISNRVSVPQLRERLEILFRTARKPGIRTVSSLDRELGLVGQRSFRQYYRGDRPSGIPGELLADFLTLFRLEMEELLLPLAAFERLMESAALGRPNSAWYSAAIHVPTQELTDSGEVSLSWPDWNLQLRLVPVSAAGPLAVPAGGAAHRTVVRGQQPFHIELSQAGASHPRMLGLLEGSELSCFLEPGEPPGGELRRRLPQPCSLEPGPCSLWLLLLGTVPVPDRELQRLRAPDTRTRRLGAEAIFAAAHEQAPAALAVLRADLVVES